MFTVKIHSKTNRRWIAARAEIKGLTGKRAEVRAGLVGAKANAIHSNSDISVAAVGAIQEFGSDTIPPRPFIKATFAKHNAEYRKLYRSIAPLLLKGVTHNKILEAAGKKIVEDIKQTIQSSMPPPNAESTIRQKGFNHPLIGVTEELLDAVDYRIAIVPK